MNIFLLIETLFKLLGIWDGLKAYISNKELLAMRSDLLKAHEAQKIIENAKTDTDIFNAQSDINKHT